MVIVYTSQTGFTLEYARMLAQAERLPLMELGEACAQLKNREPVLYLGPLMAGHIRGIDKAVKRLNVQGVCGVGMSPPGKGALASMARANYVPPQAAVFYLQGGWAPKKAGWLKRRMVGAVTRSTRQALQAKARRTPQEQKQLDMLTRGGSFVAYENLSPIQSWLRGSGA